MDSKIKIDLELRKDQAANKLRQFEADAAAQLEKLQRVQAKYDANPTKFIGNQLAASSNAYSRRLGKIQDTQKAMDNLQMQIDKESARKGGKLFGISVNTETERFAKTFLGAYLGKELMRIGFMAAEQVGGDNHRVRVAEETATGALEGAALGAAAGSILGPFGTAIGAATGAALSFASAQIKLSKEIQRATLSLNEEMYDHDKEGGRMLQNKAFDYLQGQATAPQRVKMLKERTEQLMHGKGGFSLDTLNKRLAEFHAKGDTESQAYKRTVAARSRTLAEINGNRGEMMDAMMQTTMKFMQPSQFADSMQKQGLYAGNVVSVGDVNKGVIDELKLIRKTAEQIARSADVNGAGKDVMNTAFEALGARYGM